MRPTLADFDLTGKVCVVTGGSRGLGKAMSVGFAEAGATVVVASRKLSACEEVAASITAATGRESVGIAFHAGRWESCDGLVQRVYDRFGRVDVLVNNAGMSPAYDALSDVGETLFDKVLGVNLKGPFRLGALVGERMAAAESGSIINISSIASIHPTSRELPYAMAKAGLNCLTVGLARAYSPHVRVNTIMAGPFLTDVTKSWDMRAFQEMARDHISLRRAGDPSEVVGTALLLASEASSYITGATITVDGGSTASVG
jgi:NAD(P)-dependent dehydrogenase (short-subunit alcohol dehydrogenase family)